MAKTTTAQMTVAEYIVRQMSAWGVDVVFGVPAEPVLPFLEALRTAGHPRFIVCRHQGAAALMASAYAKVTGRPAAVVADSGPGAVQMLNGVFDAFMDRVPLLVITGEQPQGRDRAYVPQAVDVDTLFRDATVFDHTLVDGAHAPRLVTQALRQALFRSRPARIGVPQDAWTDKVRRAHIAEQPSDLGGTVPTDERAVQRAAEMLEEAERPVLYAGLGAGKAVEPLLQLAEKAGAPIVHTMPALGLIPASAPWNMGVVGKYGTDAAAKVLAHADLIVAVGATFWQPEYVAPSARVIHVDKIREHIGLTFAVDKGIWGHAEDVLPRLLLAVSRAERPEWRRLVSEAREQLAGEVVHMRMDKRDPLKPGTVMAALGHALPPGAIVALDVGNHTFWFSRYHRAERYKLLLSGRWRTVGFALPAGIAAKLAHPDRPVVVVCGDGGFSMSMAELATAVQYKLPMVCVVLRDGRFGQEETLQKMTGAPRFGTRIHIADLAAYARACGATGYRIETFEELTGALSDAFSKLADGQLSVLDVTVDRVEPRFARPHTAVGDAEAPDGKERRNGQARSRSNGARDADTAPPAEWEPVPFT